jgi:hypothetical protein
MQAEPQKEHRWLEKLVGEWRYEGEATMPGGATEKFAGTEQVRSLGGLWVVAEGRGEMPGGKPATMIMTLGYDPKRRRYIGTWLGSMMSHLWIYDGSLDAEGKVLTLTSEGPSFVSEGKSAPYQDIIEWVSDDHRMLRSRTQQDDGTWNEFMTAHYRRQT